MMLTPVQKCGHGNLTGYIFPETGQSRKKQRVLKMLWKNWLPVSNLRKGSAATVRGMYISATPGKEEFTNGVRIQKPLPCWPTIPGNPYHWPVIKKTTCWLCLNIHPNPAICSTESRRYLEIRPMPQALHSADGEIPVSEPWFIL